MITIRDLQSGNSVTLQAPSGFTSYKVMGSARFSPAGDRVAFGMGKNNPDDEQGWVAIGNTAGGTANIILTSGSGEYYTVQGWLDDRTLLVQSTSVGNPGGVNQIWTVSADGSVVTKMSDGTFLTVIDNR
jgi:tricorn protease-like protein